MRSSLQRRRSSSADAHQRRDGTRLDEPGPVASIHYRGAVTDTREPHAASPNVRTPVLLIAVIAVLVAMWLAREIIAPAALAAVLGIIVHPVRHPLERGAGRERLAA